VPALFLNILKLLFIALVYLFLWQIARAIAAHLGGGSTLRRVREGAELVLIRSEGQSGVRIPIEDVLVMGRSPDADFLLDDPYASEFHLRLALKEGQVVLSDLGSTNGTYLNGRRITVPTPLSKGDAVQVGKTIMEVQ
jgi:pSer/pThr/pTyr-binding forkhead associated (FHA) protein